jgi:hypothetical protein
MSVFSLLKKVWKTMNIEHGRIWSKLTVFDDGSGKQILAMVQLKPIAMDIDTGIMACVLMFHAAEKITINDAAKWAVGAVELYSCETDDNTPIAISRIELDYPTYRTDAYAPWRGEGK